MTEKRTITPEEVKSKTPERFWSKIKFGEPNDCWLWVAAKDPNGYGRFGIRKTGFIPKGKKTYKSALAHRFMYESIFGKLEASLCALHNCPNGDNPTCVNPQHLWCGDMMDNTHDMINKGRQRYDNVLFGSKHGMSKLNEENVLVIKIRILTGESYASIARSFKVDPAIISRIDKKKLWKHVILQQTI